MLYRIAMLGQSYVAGDGVSDGEPFEAIVEQRLNGFGGGASALVAVRLVDI